jgi:hypothetical protein
LYDEWPQQPSRQIGKHHFSQLQIVDINHIGSHQRNIVEQ